MRNSSVTIILTACVVSHLACAFTVTQNSRVKSVRCSRHTAMCALPRIPFLQRTSEKVEEFNAATVTSPVDKMQTGGVDESLITDTSAMAVETTKELSETEKLLKQVKEAGLAGVISYALWELGFWAVSVPVVLFGYYEVTGHWPDLSDKTDLTKLSAEAFAFVNFARFAVPLRIGLALSTTPWIQSNIVDRFMKKEDPDTDLNE